MAVLGGGGEGKPQTSFNSVAQLWLKKLRFYHTSDSSRNQTRSSRTRSFKSDELRAAWGCASPGVPGRMCCPSPAFTCRGEAGAVRGRARPRPAPRGRPAAVGGWEASAAGKQQLRLLIRFGGGVGGVCGKSQAMDLPFFWQHSPLQD